MWFYMIGAVLVLLGLIGLILGGGIYTIALIPIGFVVFVSAVGYAMWGRAQAGAAGGETEGAPAAQEPLPHQRRREPAHVPNSPDRLVDTRRSQQ
jgi:hypothetical protein